MKVDILTLCDNAQEYSGKLVIIGAYNILTPQKYPFMLPEFAIAARALFENAQIGEEHRATLTLAKSDGTCTLLTAPEMKMKLDNITSGENITSNFIIKANNITIPSAGEYTITMNLDEETFQTKAIFRDVKG